MFTAYPRLPRSGIPSYLSLGISFPGRFSSYVSLGLPENAAFTAPRLLWVSRRYSLGLPAKPHRQAQQNLAGPQSHSAGSVRYSGDVERVRTRQIIDAG
jgi:hypothetical protein